jgi:hypothetical protein
MTFQEFLQFKTAQAIVEHIETLSEAEAREFVDQLDESTIQLIEAVLSEIKTTTPIEQQIANLERKLEKQANEAKTRAALGPKDIPPMYGDDPEQNKKLSRAERISTSGVNRRGKMTRIKTKIDQKRARARKEAEERAREEAERDEQRRNFERDTMRGFR